MSLLASAFLAWLEASWHASCLLAPLLLLRALAPRSMPARIWMWLWIVAGARLLLPVSLPVAWSPFGLLPPAPFATSAAFAADTPTPRTAAASTESGSANATGRSTLQAAKSQADSVFDSAAGARAVGSALLPSGEIPGHTAGGAPGSTVLQAAACVWLLGVVALAALRALALRRFARRLWSDARPPQGDAARRLALRTAPASDAAAALDTPAIADGTDRAAAPTPDSARERISWRILITPSVATPALYGWLRPRLLFPPGLLERLTPDELSHVLAHERAHVERRDLCALSLLRAATLLHWLNPLAWLLLRRAREDCELACDERVLDRLSQDQRPAYGCALLRVVQLTTSPEAPLAAPPSGIAMAADGRQLHQRIAMIATHRTATTRRTVFAGLLFASLASLSFTRPASESSSVSATTGTTPATDVSHAASYSASAAVASATHTVAAPTPPPGPASLSAALPRPEGNVTFRPHTVPTSVGAQAFSYRRFAYDASTDRLDALFPNGIVATLGERSVTVADVRRELEPLVPQLQREAKDQADFERLVGRLQNDVISNLLRRHLLVQRFRGLPTQDTDAVVSPEAVDRQLAEILRVQFDNSRPRLLAHLEKRGLTEAEFRREVEEDLIWTHMRRQERQADAAAKQAADASRPKGPQVHLRIIQLNRKDAAESDDALRARAAAILARHGQGESFAKLAREFDESRRRDREGDWGWQSPTALKPAFREALASLPKGSAAAPMITAEGCFLLFAEDWR